MRPSVLTKLLALASVYLLTVTALQATPAIPAPPREYRAAWCATVTNIDWPPAAGVSAATVTSQKNRLLAHLDALADAKMNAIYFQVRPACDAMYNSTIEPPSQWLTGSQKTAATWDPLAFAVSEGHKRGIEVHAWVNPYRAALDQNTSTKAANHVMIAHPDYCVAYSDGRTYLDPGKPEVITYIESVIAEIVTNYDVDGVVFDDYFYPGTNFGDSGSYKDYLDSGGSMGIDDWRRDNVNRLIFECSEMIHAIRRSCQFEVGPFGIWRPGYPTGVTGSDYYAGHYCDTRLWLQQGWVDSLSPQLYWPLASPGQPFAALIEWWAQQNPARHVLASTADYRVGSSAYANWGGTTNAEIVNQVITTYQKGGVGTVHYSIKYLTDDINQQRTALKAGPYALDALRPASTWLDNVPPPAPDVDISAPSGTPAMRTISFAQPRHAEAATWWCVYTYDGTAWKLKVLPGATTSLQVADGLEDFAVFAVDRCGNMGPRGVRPQPNAPSGLTAAFTGSGVNLAWADNSSDETGFEIRRASISGGPYTLVGLAPSNATSYTDLVPGPRVRYYVVKSTRNGVPSAASNEATVVCVTGPPAAPVVQGINASSDSGISNLDRLTKIATPTVVGTGEQNLTVTVYADGAVVGTGHVSDAGNWSVVISALTDGTHVLTAMLADELGNLSSLSDALSVTIDTIAPTASIGSVSSGTRYQPVSSVSINFSKPVYGFGLASLGLTRGGLPVSLSSAVLNGSGSSWVLENTAAITSEAGTYELSVNTSGITDAAGNALATKAKVTWLMDTRTDLVLGKSVNPPTAHTGDLVSYALGISNAGLTDAQNVVLTDPLPRNVELVSESVTASNVDGTTRTWNLGTLRAGEATTITLIARVTEMTVITNTASVTCSSEEPNQANNVASASVVVGPGADLSVSMTATPTPAQLGQPLSYLITVQNLGPDTAGNVAVVDSIPANTILSGATVSQGTVDTSSGNAVGNLTSLAREATATMTVTVVPQQVGRIVNVAGVTSNAYDRNDANSSATTALDVVQATGPDLTGEWQTPRVSSDKKSITAKIRVSNRGNQKSVSGSAVAFYVSSRNTLDSSARPASSKRLGSVRPGQSVMVTSTLRVDPPTGPRYLIAVIDSNNKVVESNESNNTVVFGPMQ